MALVLLAASAGLRAQPIELGGEDREQFIQGLFPWPEQDLDYGGLYEQQLIQIQLPLDINTADRDELRALWILDEVQIDGLIKYREDNGPLLTLYELLAVPGIDAATIGMLEGMILVSAFDRPATRPEGYILVQAGRVLERQAGYLQDSSLNGYLGDPWRMISRFHYAERGRYGVGFVAEKDAGEKLVWDASSRRYGMDYYAAYAMIENKGPLERLIIGDFVLDEAQGLVFGNGFRNGLGHETVSTARRSGNGMYPYRSVYEGRKFRGMAACIRAGSILTSVFYSGLRRDGIIRADGSDEEPEITVSLQQTGYHRTMTELQRKHAVAEHSAGLTVAFASANPGLRLGVNALYTHYDTDLKPTAQKYNHFAFRGRENYVTGIHGAWQLKSVEFFGEMARSASGGIGALAGFIGRLSPAFSTSLLWRRYTPDFHSFQANAFREGTVISNESGFYWGMEMRLIPRVYLSASVDHFQYPWMKYRVDAPSQGFNYLTMVQVNPGRRFQVQVLYRIKGQERNAADEDAVLNALEMGIRQMLAMRGIYDSGGAFRLKTRAQGSSFTFAGNRTYGYMLAQEVQFRRGGLNMAVEGSYFNAANYDNRQYLYERDLWLNFSMPSFQGEGIRLSFFAGMRLIERLALGIKAGRTIYLDRQLVGTGADQIIGSARTAVSSQLRYNF